MAQMYDLKPFKCKPFSSFGNDIFFYIKHFAETAQSNFYKKYANLV